MAYSRWEPGELWTAYLLRKLQGQGQIIKPFQKDGHGAQWSIGTPININIYRHLPDGDCDRIGRAVRYDELEKEPGRRCKEYGESLLREDIFMHVDSSKNDHNLTACLVISLLSESVCSILHEVSDDVLEDEGIIVNSKRVMFKPYLHVGGVFELYKDDSYIHAEDVIRDICAYVKNPSCGNTTICFQRIPEEIVEK